MLRHKWIPLVFPAALLVHGPMPNVLPRVGMEYGWVATDESEYKRKLRDWYITNYVKYDEIDQRTAITLRAFTEEYAKWFTEQLGERT